MIGIIDYGVGNLASINNMLKKAGVPSEIVNHVDQVHAATRLILPGMGHFDNCMVRLKESGLLPAIEKRVHEDFIPVLGICVGLQMLMASSEEGVEPGLGWIPGKTVKFDAGTLGPGYKIPNMGWLEVIHRKSSPLLDELEGARFYFAHSYYVQPAAEKGILLSAVYGTQFTVGIEVGNIKGVQFHPKKSHRFGLQLLKNFATKY